MPEVYEKVEVTIERKELNACLRQLPPMSSSEEAIKNAVSQFLRDLSKVKVGRDTLKEISRLTCPRHIRWNNSKE